MKVHPKLDVIIDEYNKVYISKTPLRGNAIEFKDYPPRNIVCGVCGNDNVKLIHYTSGATSDGTVEVNEVQCLDCNYFTMIFWSDRV